MNKGTGRHFVSSCLAVQGICRFDAHGACRQCRRTKTLKGMLSKVLARFPVERVILVPTAAC